MSPHAISRCNKTTIMQLRTQSKKHLSHSFVLFISYKPKPNHSAMWRYDFQFHFQKCNSVDLRRVRCTVQVSSHLSATKMTLATHLADLILKGMTDNFSYLGGQSIKACNSDQSL